jgi:DNA-binding PadR family transcriptional regulator
MRDIELTLMSAKVLKAFLADPARPRYGLELAQEAKVGIGTLYPILYKLTDAGWLSQVKEDVDPKAAGRPRRMLYTLTAEALPVARAKLAAIGAQFTERTGR